MKQTSYWDLSQSTTISLKSKRFIIKLLFSLKNINCYKAQDDNVFLELEQHKAKVMFLINLYGS